jgi:ADP-ribose pyrophosphatase
MKVEILDEKRVFDGFFKINQATLRHERFNGQMSATMTRLNFERGDAVAALLWNAETGRVLLTKQFRYPAHTKGHAWMVEAIAGTLKEGEDPAEAMQRELLEETGYQAPSLQWLQTFFVSPGGTSERIFLFFAEVRLADKVAAGGGLEQEHEDIALVEWTPGELADALRSGVLCDAKTIIAAQWFLQQYPPLP